jgi:hypothetical protein
MKIFIQGRKDGYNVLYPNPTPDEFYKFASDIQRIDAQNDVRLYGQSFYSLAFTIEGVIFSKYIIGYDDQRSNLGYIGISVFMPIQKKIAGIDIRMLLDELINTYYKNYCPDFYIRNKQEDWILFNTLAENYDKKLFGAIENYDNIKSGSAEAAYIYFKDIAELQKYFEEPFQEKYNSYRQILFINNDFKSKPENPLNALRNSDVDLTDEIDLENPNYRLLFNGNSNSCKILVKANGNSILSGTKFRRKDELDIKWSKQYFVTENKRGKCYEMKDKFISVNQEARTVTIQEIELEPEQKTITFEIKDRNGKLINEAEILIENNFDSKFKPVEWRKAKSANQVIPFKGDNIGRSWTVIARKGSDLVSEPHRIDFEKDCNRIIELTLNEKKELKIIAHKENLDGDVIDDIQVSKTIFTNNEINQPHTITVTSFGYQSYSFVFHPLKDENPKHIVLQRQSQTNKKTYNVSGGNHGNLNNNYLSYKSDGSDLDRGCIIPDKGWIFTCWKLVDNTLVAQYKKKPFYTNPIFIASSIVFVIALVIGIWKINPFNNNNNNSDSLKVEVNSDSINNYLQGNELMMSELVKLRTDREKYLSQMSQKQQDSIENISSENRGFLGWILGDDEEANNYDEEAMISEDLFSNDTIWQKIKLAIELRDSINTLNFEYLKKQEYSHRQNEFKVVIESVRPADYDLIKNELNPIEMTLIDIASSIYNILKTKKTEQSLTTDKVEKEKVKHKEPVQSKNILDKKDTPNEIAKPKISNKDEDIRNYLKGSVLKSDELNKFRKQTTDKEIKKSIDLCLKLWELKGTDGNSYYSIQKLCDSDNILKNSDLNTILKKINSKTTAIEYAGLATSTNIMTKLKDKAK